MYPGSDFLDYLKVYSQHPDGAGGTDWTNMGSYEDETVEPHSATDMSADHRVLYLANEFVTHDTYFTDTTDLRDADLHFKDGGSYYTWQSGPHPVRWIDYAMFHYNW
jgi:hypothetical protein